MWLGQVQRLRSCAIVVEVAQGRGAGGQENFKNTRQSFKSKIILWIPAFVGMTERVLRE